MMRSWRSASNRVGHSVRIGSATVMEPLAPVKFEDVEQFQAEAMRPRLHPIRRPWVGPGDMKLYSILATREAVR
jgi:hypothetical protein